MSTDPSTTALADQLAMYTKKNLAELASAVAEHDATHGGAQSGADFTAYLTGTHPPSYLAALVIAAVRRIRELELELEQEART